MSLTPKLTIALCVVVAFVAGRYWPQERTVVTPPPLERAGPASSKPPAEDPLIPAPDSASQAEALYDRFVAHLNANAWISAVELYDAVYSRFDETVSSRFRARLLDSASTSLSQAPRRSVDLLSAYTGIYFQDVPALELLADGLMSIGKTESALNALHEAYLAAHLPIDQTRIQTRIDQIVERHAQQFWNRKNYAALVKLYQSLVDQRPGYALYYMHLAEAHLQDGNEAEARRALRYIQYDLEFGDEARQRIARLDSAAPHNARGTKISVPLTRLGNNFVVTVLINNAPLRLLLDTGASVSVLRAEAASRVGAIANTMSAVSLETANGRIRAPLARVSRLNIGGDTLPDLKVAIVDLGSLDSVDGLLGMDVLSRYQVIIDRQNTVLHLVR